MSETPGQVLSRVLLDHEDWGGDADYYRPTVDYEAAAAAFLAEVGVRCVECGEVVARGEGVRCDRCGYLLAQERDG